jgi:hypothetical protein
MVRGCNLVPEPPAKTIPFISFALIFVNGFYKIH